MPLDHLRLDIGHQQLASDATPRLDKKRSALTLHFLRHGDNMSRNPSTRILDVAPRTLRKMQPSTASIHPLQLFPPTVAETPTLTISHAPVFSYQPKLPSRPREEEPRRSFMKEKETRKSTGIAGSIDRRGYRELGEDDAKKGAVGCSGRLEECRLI